MTRAVDFAVPLASYSVLPLLDQCLYLQLPYLTFVTWRQAGSFKPRIDTNSSEADNHGCHG